MLAGVAIFLKLTVFGVIQTGWLTHLPVWALLGFLIIGSGLRLMVGVGRAMTINKHHPSYRFSDSAGISTDARGSAVSEFHRIAAIVIFLLTIIMGIAFTLLEVNVLKLSFGLGRLFSNICIGAIYSAIGAFVISLTDYILLKVTVAAVSP